MEAGSGKESCYKSQQGHARSSDERGEESKGAHFSFLLMLKVHVVGGLFEERMSFGFHFGLVVLLFFIQVHC